MSKAGLRTDLAPATETMPACGTNEAVARQDAIVNAEDEQKTKRRLSASSLSSSSSQPHVLTGHTLAGGGGGSSRAAPRSDRKSARGSSILEDSEGATPVPGSDAIALAEKDSEKALSDEHAAKASPLFQGDGFPDGGFKAWASAAGCGICFFVSFGLYVGTAGTYQRYWSENQLAGYSQSAIAWISSIQVFLIYFSGSITGPLFQMGLYRWLLGGSMLLFVFCQMMTSLCTEYYQFILAQGIGIGLSQGILFNTCAVVPMEWFYRKRALVTALTVSASSLGGVVWPIVVSRLLERIGWGWTMRFIGFTSAVLLFLAFLMVRTRLTPVGLAKNKSMIATLVDIDALRYPPFAWLVGGCAFVMLAFYIPYQFVPLYAGSRGFALMGSDYIAILNGMSTVFRIFPSMLADRLGKMNVFIPCAFGISLCVLLLPLITSSAGLVIYCLFFAIAAGSWIGLYTACVAQLGPVTTMGPRIGLTMVIISVPALVSTPIVGALIGDASSGEYHWWPAAGFGGGCAFCGTLCFLVSRHLARRDTTSWKI